MRMRMVKKMTVSSLLFLLVLLMLFSSASAQESITVGLLFGVTGPASPIGPVQRDGAILAIQEINESGGVNIGGKQVKLEYIFRDDENNAETALRRFRELVFTDDVDFVVGQSMAPTSAILNKAVMDIPMVYFPVNVQSSPMFRQENLGPYTFSVHGSSQDIGYAGVDYIVNVLGYDNIVFFAPAYDFGHDQWRGAQNAARDFNVTIDYMEAPVGTPDFTSYIETLRSKDPDIVMLAQWGVDAINVLNQIYETGYKDEVELWFNWMTNVYGSGVDPGAIDGVFSLMSWYWDMDGFNDESVVEKTKEFSDKFWDMFGYAPDPYSAMAYIGVMEAVRGIELAGSTDPDEVKQALLDNPDFLTMKGPGSWRIDQQPFYQYGAFVVQGRNPDEREHGWDIVRVIDAYTGENYLPSLESLGY